MKDTNRYIALALCLSLTLGAFVYRPPEAKAIVLVDDAAIVVSAIVAVMAYGGYRFWLNNIDAGTFSDIIKPKVKQWNYQHGSSAEDPYSGFAEWSAGGMDNFRNSITPDPGNSGPDMKGLSWLMAGALFEKVCEFVEWLGKELGVQPGVEEPVPIVPSPAGGSGSVTAANVLDKALSLAYFSYSEAAKRYPDDSELYFNAYQEIVDAKYKVAVYHPGPLMTQYMDRPYLILWSNERPISLSLDGFGAYVKIHGYVNVETGLETGAYVTRVFLGPNAVDRWHQKSDGSAKWDIVCNYVPGVVFTGMETAPAPAPSATLALPGKWAPVLPAEGAETVPMVIPGAAPAEALDVDALAQEILKRLSQNELEVKPSGSQIVDPGTQPDTKPSINPGTDTEGLGLFGWLKRIWQSIVALPAQIAEKIGAFFTTLWGWLQSIIDAIKALPAAIAEKIKALFVPREGYAAEFVADITATYQGRMGLLTYPFTVLADFVGTVATLEEQEPVLRWDAVEWQNKTIIAAGEYNLKSAVSSAQMQTVYMIYKTVVSGMLVVAFLHLCYKKLKEVQRN
ncbi:hypothetical protein JQM63_04630 [Oscillibacter valericigenes]|nr:hypothetical protein [Oscillibacter valericigenes]